MIAGDQNHYPLEVTRGQDILSLVEEIDGIEPPPSGYEPEMLPLHYIPRFANLS